MSYIPKYIIKRLIPENGVVAEGDVIKVNAVNVISPIAIDEVPDDFMNFIELKVDDKVVLDGTHRDGADKLSLGYGGKSYNTKNLKEAQGQTIPVGGQILIVFPNTPKLEKGSMHKFTVTIKTNNPINIEFERKVN